MINTSSAYKEAIKTNRILHHKAEISFADGTTVIAEDADMFTFQVADNTSNANSFDLGSAIAQQLTLKLDNLNGTFDSHDFNEADISIKAGVEIDGVTEWLDKGKFVSEPGEDSGDTITVNAFDNMIRFDQPYSVSNLKYPATLGAIVRDACSCCNVVLAADSASFDNDNFIVTTRPDDSVTFRQILQWAGQIACKYSKINTSGQLSLRWYDTETLESTWIRQTGDSTETVCEGNSNSVDVDQSDIVQVSDLLSGSTFTTDDVVITGVRVVEEAISGNTEEDTTYQSGADGYVLTISGNKLIQDGKGATVASYLGEKLNGLRFRPLSVKCQGDPAREAGDIGLITDRKGRSYKTILTGVTYTAYAAQSLTSGAEAPVRLSATRYSTATQVYRQFREALSKQKAEWEKAYEDLQEAMNEKAGLYPVSETLDDGSKVLYFCDKPTLEESQIVVEFNAKGWGMSTDGGDTWNTGALVDGTMIAQILNTIGVNADWIRTGALVVADDEGNIIFSVDMDTKQVLISGDSVRIGGKTATAAINDVLDDSKEYADGKLADYANAVSGDLAALQAQVDGQVEDWYYDYEPSMQNYPAAEWTTNEERTKHIGDRFFWKSKGYAYRFMETDGVWGWVLLKDTDITSAMQAAQEAQDTADGKRRVFVVTPQPPYDIGDLWCNGEDILTCGVARAQGSVFVSADWQKLNNYTDDTVANEALDEAKKARNLNIILDNEYQGIPADHEGNISTFPVVQTGVQVFYGSTDVSASCSYSIAKSGSVTGSWDNTLRTYTVTGLSADTGWVDITATYLSLFTATKRFAITKVKDGAAGADGADGKNGANGVGVKSSAVAYQASASGTSVPTGTWQTSIPSVSANQYLWTRTTITYTDGTSTISYSVGKMGATGAAGKDGTNGKDGEDGRGIKSTAVTYQASTSGTAVPTGTWVTTPPGVSANQYLWTRTVITYTDDTTSTSYSIGKMGANGTAARTYFIEPSATILKRSQNNTISPNFIEFKAFYRDGNSTERTAYAGRFKIEETTDGNTWNTLYTSGSNETSVRHELYSAVSTASDQVIVNANNNYIGVPRNVIQVRCTLYEAGGTSNAMDIQSVAVVTDVAALTHEEIFNLLTNSGEIKGIYKEGNQLYISFTYAKGGQMVLGGRKNGNGYSLIRDKNDNPIMLLDYSGLTFFTSYTENSQTYTYEGILLNRNGVQPVSATKYKDSNDEVHEDLEIVDTDENFLDFNGRTVFCDIVTATLVDGSNGIYRLCTYGEANGLISAVSHSNDVSITSVYMHTVNNVLYWYATAVLPQSSRVPAGVSSFAAWIYHT